MITPHPLTFAEGVHRPPLLLDDRFAISVIDLDHQAGSPVLHLDPAPLSRDRPDLDDDRFSTDNDLVVRGAVRHLAPPHVLA